MFDQWKKKSHCNITVDTTIKCHLLNEQFILNISLTPLWLAAVVYSCRHGESAKSTRSGFVLTYFLSLPYCCQIEDPQVEQLWSLPTRHSTDIIVSCVTVSPLPYGAGQVITESLVSVSKHREKSAIEEVWCWRFRGKPCLWRLESVPGTCKLSINNILRQASPYHTSDET